MTWQVPPPPPASRRSVPERIALVLGIVLSALVALGGLFVVAVGILAVVSLNSIGSNK